MERVSREVERKVERVKKEGEKVGREIDSYVERVERGFRGLKRGLKRLRWSLRVLGGSIYWLQKNMITFWWQPNNCISFFVLF